MFETDYQLDGEYEFCGEWWAPKSPDSRLPGILRFSPSAIALTIFRPSDRRSVRSGFPDGYDGYWDTIHGETGSGMKVTLWSVSDPQGDMAVSVKPQVIALGGHFGDIESEQFISCYVRSPGLTEFQRFKYLETGSEFMPEYDDGGFAVRTVNRPHERWKLDCDATFFGFFHQTTQSGGFDSVSIDVKEWAYVHSEEPRTFHWCIDRLHRFCMLMTLLTASQDRIVHATLQSPASKWPCSVLYRTGLAKSGQMNSERQYILPIFKRDHCRDFRQQLEAWFSMSETMNSAVDLAIDALQTDRHTLEARFLSAVKSVEVISRSMHDGEYLSREKYDAFRDHMLKAVPEGLPDDFLDSFRTRLKFGNEVSLRRRIEGLIECLPQSMRQFVCVKHSEFARGAACTRNYLTHFTDELRTATLEGTELYYATEKLLQLSRIHLLRFVGFNDDDIERRLTAHPILGGLRREFQSVRELRQ